MNSVRTRTISTPFAGSAVILMALLLVMTQPLPQHRGRALPRSTSTTIPPRPTTLTSNVISQASHVATSSHSSGANANGNAYQPENVGTPAGVLAAGSLDPLGGFDSTDVPLAAHVSWKLSASLPVTSSLTCAGVMAANVTTQSDPSVACTLSITATSASEETSWSVVAL